VQEHERPANSLKISKHHKHPASQCKDQGLNADHPANIFEEWTTEDGKHAAWHQLVGNSAPARALKRIVQNDVFDCHITDPLLIALLHRFHPARPRKTPNARESFIYAQKVASLAIPPKKLPHRASRNAARQNHKLPRRGHAWDTLFGSMNTQDALLWIVANLFPPPSYYLDTLSDPVIIALYLRVHCNISVALAVSLATDNEHEWEQTGHRHEVWRDRKQERDPRRTRALDQHRAIPSHVHGF